jgi:hypothetical protein
MDYSVIIPKSVHSGGGKGAELAHLPILEYLYFLSFAILINLSTIYQ